MDRGDDLGLGEREQVVVALQVAGPVGEALAAVARLVGPVALDRRAHGAVDHQDPLAQQRRQLLGGVRADVDDGSTDDHGRVADGVLRAVGWCRPA